MDDFASAIEEGFDSLDGSGTLDSCTDDSRPRKRLRTEPEPSQAAPSPAQPTSVKRSAAPAGGPAGGAGTTVRERLIHLLAPMPNGCGAGTIARRLGLPINRFRDVLSSVATYEVGAVYKLKPEHYADVRVSWPDYDAAQRSQLRDILRRMNLLNAADASAAEPASSVRASTSAGANAAVSASAQPKRAASVAVAIAGAASTPNATNRRPTMPVPDLMTFSPSLSAAAAGDDDDDADEHSMQLPALQLAPSLGGNTRSVSVAPTASAPARSQPQQRAQQQQTQTQQRGATSEPKAAITAGKSTSKAAGTKRKRQDAESENDAKSRESSPPPRASAVAAAAAIQKTLSPNSAAKQRAKRVLDEKKARDAESERWREEHKALKAIVNQIGDRPAEKPALSSPAQFESTKSEFTSKYAWYQRIGAEMKHNSELFDNFGKRLEECKDAASKSSLKKEIRRRFTERSEFVALLARKYKVLHVELLNLRAALDEFSSNAAASASPSSAAHDDFTSGAQPMAVDSVGAATPASDSSVVSSSSSSASSSPDRLALLNRRLLARK